MQPIGSRGARSRRLTRSRRSLPVFAFGASLSFVLVTIVDPTAAFAITASESVEEITISPVVEGPVQDQVIADGTVAVTARDEFKITKIVVAPPVVAKAGAPAAGVPDAGSAQAIAYDMVAARGWDQSEYNCLVALWNRESHWNMYAYNAGSGAYGIPQALPGSKMASAGEDWATNPATQITWGLGYISGRYQTPCGAWGHSQSSGWY